MNVRSLKVAFLLILGIVLMVTACAKRAKKGVKVSTARYHHESGPSDYNDTTKVKKSKLKQ